MTETRSIWVRFLQKELAPFYIVLFIDPSFVWMRESISQAHADWFHAFIPFRRPRWKRIYPDWMESLAWISTEQFKLFEETCRNIYCSCSSIGMQERIGPIYHFGEATFISKNCFFFLRLSLYNEIYIRFLLPVSGIGLC